MMPKTYTSREDGEYKRWNHGNVEKADLDRWSPDKDTVFINGVMVFGLYFETSPGVGRKWNCKYGWSEKGML